MPRKLTAAEQKKYAAMGAQAKKQVAAISNGTIGKQVAPSAPKPNPPKVVAPAAPPALKLNKNPTVNTPPPQPVKTNTSTLKPSGGGNNRSGGGASQNKRQSNGSIIPKGFDPIGSGVKKLDAATGIVSKITGSKQFQGAVLTGAKAIVGAGEGVKKLNQGYGEAAGSPMRQSQDAIKNSYMGAAAGINSKKANETAAKVTDKYITKPYLKSGMAKNLGNLGGATRGLVDLTTPVYSADSLGRGTGGALEAMDVSASALGPMGLLAGASLKTLRKAEDFVKLYDKSVDIVELGKKSAKAVDALKNAPTVKPTNVTAKTSVTAAQLDTSLANGAKLFKDPAGGYLMQFPGKKAMRLDISDLKKHDDAAIAKMTTKDKKFEAPAEEKIDVRDFKPGTFKGTSADLQAGVAKIFPVKGEKQINMSKEQVDMLVSERTAARKAAGLKTGTPESKDFNKKFDEKWYAQKGVQPNGGRAKTGEYQVTMADGSKHLINAKDHPELDLDALGKSKAGTAGKSADSRVKAPAGGPKLVTHILENAKAGGKTSTTVKNALTKAVADKKISQKEMDDAMFQFQDATGKQGPPAPKGKLSKSVNEHASKSKSFYLNKDNDVTFTKVDGTKVQIKAKDMSPEDIVLLKQMKEGKDVAAKAATKPEAIAKQGTVSAKGTYIPTEAEKLAAQEAAKQARVGKTFATKEEKTAFNKDFYDKYYAGMGKGKPVTPATPKAPKTATPERIAGDKAVAAEIAKGAKTPNNMSTPDTDAAATLANNPEIVRAEPHGKTGEPGYYVGWEGGAIDDWIPALGVKPGNLKKLDALAEKTKTAAYLKGENVSAPTPSKAATLAPTPPTSPEVKAIPTPKGKGGVQSKKNSNLRRRGANPPEEWDNLVQKQAEGAAKVENSKAAGGKGSAWRIINKDGSVDEYPKAELSNDTNNMLQSMRAATPTAQADGAAVLAKTDATPVEINQVEPSAPAPVVKSTVAPKAVDDVVTQVSNLKKTATLDAAAKTPMPLNSDPMLAGAKTDAMIPQSTSLTTMENPAGTTDLALTPTNYDTPLDPNATLDPGAALPGSESMAMGAEIPTQGAPGAAASPGGYQYPTNYAGKSNVGGGNTKTAVPKSWASRHKGGLIAGVGVGSVLAAGYMSGKMGEAGPVGPEATNQSLLDMYNGGAAADIGAGTGGGGQNLGGGFGAAAPQMPQVSGQPAAETGGQPGTPTKWYAMGPDGQLEGPYDGIIGPDNLTYYQDESGNWVRVPDGAVVDAPNGTDYQRGAGMGDEDPTNDNIYDPANPYIPTLQEIIDPELDQIIEENGGYTVENLMEVYAPYIESQNAEIDAQVEADITALREQLAARGMYNSDIALTQEMQIRSAGEAKKQGIYQEMLQQAQELAMEYEYKYAQLGEEQRMNDYEIESGDREFQQAVKEFEAETGIKWATLDLKTQQELFDQYDANRKYNLSEAKFTAGQSGGGGGGGGATAATLVKIQNELGEMLGGGASPATVIAKAKSYVSLGYMNDAQAQSILANLDSFPEE